MFFSAKTLHWIFQPRLMTLLEVNPFISNYCPILNPLKAIEMHVKPLEVTITRG